jgi:L-2-hydroxyglutarate oxidase LhgO
LQEDFKKKGKIGVRAQLFDRKSKKLEMDFVVESDSDSTHILNAVSPAWTTSLSFAKHVVKEYL